MNQITVRPAEAADLDFLVWAMATAGRSHLDATVWSKMFGRDEAWILDLLAAAAQSPEPHWCHLSRFWVAEADGRPAGAMSGFDPATQGNDALSGALLTAAMELGLEAAEIEGVLTRAALMDEASPKTHPEVWGAENVAVKPEFRGRGVLEALFEAVAAQGRAQGRRRLQILCLNGNERALKAWARNGFDLRADYRSEACHAVFGSPGLKLMLRPIDEEAL